ncbi:MAG TPA: NAD-dependent epimerase/dehydratase family protein [Nocardioidaceae bacterium]|nr:NAD-dependent epimerase/dehydratase family protein [Nocardioidaceae bacterium]
MSGADGAEQTLLLTGAQGFLGRHVAMSWLRRHPEGRVVGVGRSAFDVDHFTYAHHVIPAARAALSPDLRGLAGHPGWSYLRLDLTDPDAVRSTVRDVRPGLVIHSAAALRDQPLPELVAANVLATAALARAVSDLVPEARFVNVSSGSVYGLSSTSDASRADPEPYAVTKRAAELAVAAECTASGLAAASGRVFNLIGPGLQDRHLPGRIALELALMEGRDIGEVRVGSLEAERDLIDVRDAADALTAVASAPATAFDRLPAEGPLRIIDVGTGRLLRMRDLVRLQLEAAGLAGKVDVIESEARPMGAAALRADPAAIAELGASPQIPLERSVAEMADYARNQC